MITKDQAQQIMILAINYANYEAAAETSDMNCYYNTSRKYAEQASNTWLKLKELVDNLTEK